MGVVVRRYIDFLVLSLLLLYLFFLQQHPYLLFIFYMVYIIYGKIQQIDSIYAIPYGRYTYGNTLALDLTFESSSERSSRHEMPPLCARTSRPGPSVSRHSSAALRSRPVGTVATTSYAQEADMRIYQSPGRERIQACCV